MLQGHKGVLGMKLMWGGHIDGIDVRIGAEVFDSFIDLSVKLSLELCPGLLPQIGACCEFDVRMREYLRERRSGSLAQTSDTES